MITVKIYVEPFVGETLQMAWWAESDDLPGWSASADSLSELKVLVVDGVRFELDDDDVKVSMVLVPTNVDRAEGPSRVTPSDLEKSQAPHRPVEISRAIGTTTPLVPA